MTSHRKVEIPFTDAPRGTCRWCGEAIKGKDGKINKRRRWHEDCVHTYLIANDPNYIRNELKKRDGGICQGCGVNIADLMNWIRRLRSRIMFTRCSQRRFIDSNGKMQWCQKFTKNWRHIGNCKVHSKLNRLFALKYGAFTTPSGWAADHIVPLIDGGAKTLENLQTLCDRCHKAKTAKEAKERAAKRRGQQLLGL